MKKFILCLLIMPALAYAQTTITGKIFNDKEEALPGANVYIKNSYDGISSDSTGNFSFITYEQGSAILVVSFVGYKSFEKEVLLDGKPQSHEIILNSESSRLEEVVISAGSFEASDEKKGVMLRPLDIVTTGSEADIYSAMETLPGTQLVGETEGLFVRGGSASETKTIIDEMIVLKPFFSSIPDVPQRSRFSPFIFKGTIFSTGGYSAQYGQALSSALILKSEDLADDTRSAISLMAAGFGGGHTQRWENTSLSLEANYYNLHPYFEVQKQRTEWEKAPVSYDGTMLLRHKFSDTGMLKVFSYYNTSNLSLYNREPDTPELRNYFGLKNNNFYLNTGYNDIIGDNWTIFGGVSYSRDRDKLDLASDDYNSNEDLFQTKFTLSRHIWGKSFLTFGGELHKSTFKDVFNQYTMNADELYSAAYVEADVFLTNKFAGRFGFRGEHSKILDSYNAAPRISLAYKLGDYDQINFAYGLFFQSPEKDLLFQWRDFSFEKAAHYILNYQYVGENRTFRIEAYYKDYDKLAKGTVYTFPYMNLPYTAFSSNGKGYAKGIDVFWRDRQTIDLSEYWLSYSFLDTRRDFRNYPAMAFPTFAAPHTFSVVFKTFIPAITSSLGITYSFASGRPYYNPNNSEFLGDRGKNYQNLSMNLSYLTNIFGNFTVIFFSMDNVLGYENIFGYRYSSDGTFRTPVTAPALRSAFVGIFISIGENTTPF